MVTPPEGSAATSVPTPPVASAATSPANTVAASSEPTQPSGKPSTWKTSPSAGSPARTVGEVAAKAAGKRAAARRPTKAAAGTQARDVPSASASAAPAAFGKPGAPEEVTANLRLPKPANGPGTGQPVAHRGTVADAIPQPGPAAATPPPWNRVPGQEPAPSPVENRPPMGDGIFDDSEGPTAFLHAPTPRSDIEDRPGQPSTTAAPSRTGGRTRPPRQASLQLKRLDPWSVLKLALVLAVVLFFIWLVAVGVLYGVLDGIGVWDRLNGTYADLVSGEAPSSGSPLISAGRVFGIAAVVGAINSLLFAVAVTVGAFVYNVSADLVGGIEVTLSERD